MDIKTEPVQVVNLVANWQFLTRGVQCTAKYELKSSNFVLTSDINWLLWYTDSIKVIFSHSIMFLEKANVS